MKQNGLQLQGDGGGFLATLKNKCPTCGIVDRYLYLGVLLNVPQ